ncbi:ISAs1 family transposase [Tautonia sociabilis]|uniref:ISAs1 family transposase n=1 Tax=Tautonia sociabilis TaxID=2080755 RepID=A0A432MI15_9BACT|nr:ISAs1 family transposase [Tautonia sociabilis]RUL86831.1 ISAs1 family transposase [Tautonia sociabilis]
MTATPADSLLAAFGQLTDPRHRRGVRHPFASLLALTFLGLLCRQPDFAAIARWARHHWDELAGPLGFTRDSAPHQTTLSRAAACYSVAEFRAALAGWLAGLLGEDELVAAVDGKTSKQAHVAEGRPIHTLNVLAHGVKLALADWPVDGEKKTEPEVLKAHLDELFAAYPGLRVLTGDALFCQRPLARAIVEAGRDYVLAVKDNQPELHEAARTAFTAATAETAAATTREKNAGRWSHGGSGAMRQRPTLPARR